MVQTMAGRPSDAGLQATRLVRFAQSLTSAERAVVGSVWAIYQALDNKLQRCSNLSRSTKEIGLRQLGDNSQYRTIPLSTVLILLPAYLRENLGSPAIAGLSIAWYDYLVRIALKQSPLEWTIENMQIGNSKFTTILSRYCGRSRRTVKEDIASLQRGTLSSYMLHTLDWPKDLKHVSGFYEHDGHIVLVNLECRPSKNFEFMLDGWVFDAYCNGVDKQDLLYDQLWFLLQELAELLHLRNKDDHPDRWCQVPTVHVDGNCARPVWAQHDPEIWLYYAAVNYLCPTMISSTSFWKSQSSSAMEALEQRSNCLESLLDAMDIEEVDKPTMAQWDCQMPTIQTDMHGCLIVPISLDPTLYKKTTIKTLLDWLKLSPLAQMPHAGNVFVNLPLWSKLFTDSDANETFDAIVMVCRPSSHNSRESDAMLRRRSEAILALHNYEFQTGTQPSNEVVFQVDQALIPSRIRLPVKTIVTMINKPSREAEVFTKKEFIWSIFEQLDQRHDSQVLLLSPGIDGVTTNVVAYQNLVEAYPNTGFRLTIMLSQSAHAFLCENGNIWVNECFVLRQDVYWCHFSINALVYIHYIQKLGDLSTDAMPFEEMRKHAALLKLLGAINEAKISKGFATDIIGLCPRDLPDGVVDRPLPLLSHSCRHRRTPHHQPRNNDSKLYQYPLDRVDKYICEDCVNRFLSLGERAKYGRLLFCTRIWSKKVLQALMAICDQNPLPPKAIKEEVKMEDDDLTNSDLGDMM